MLRNILPILLSLVIGCAVSTESEETTQGYVYEKEPGRSQHPGGFSSYHNQGCGVEIFELYDGQGNLVEMVIPIPCNPYWMYEDPGPYKSITESQHTNPDPVSYVNESKNYE